MSDETNVASATETAPQLKSTDTRVKAPEITPEVKPEPVKETANAESETPEGGESDAQTADSSKKQKKLPRWMKERLERVRQVTEAETRAKVLDEMRSKESEKPEKPKAEKAEKTIEDFDYDQDAYLDWKLEQKLKAREEADRAEKAKKAQAEEAEKFKARIDAFEEKVGDGAWEEIEESKLNRDKKYKPLADMVQQEEEGLEIAYYLAKNPEKAEELVGLSPVKMAMGIARIAEQLAGKQEKPAPTLPKKVTNAPPPPKTVSGSGKASVDVFAPELSAADRIAMWRKKA